MTDATGEAPARRLVLDYELEAPPQKVWRAISIPAFREHWLPEEALAEPEGEAVAPGEAVRYRMRDRDPPFLESVVTFRIAPGENGGTRLRVIHELAAAAPASNDNRPTLLLAA